LLGALGVSAILAGAGIGFFGDRFGIALETARLVGSVLVLAGIGDLVAAMLLDRIMGKGNR
jgi:hypothetical protein